MSLTLLPIDPNNFLENDIILFFYCLLLGYITPFLPLWLKR